MDLLCKVCDRSIVENESEYKIFLTALHKKDDKCVYKKYVKNNINLDEVDKIYIYSSSKHQDFYQKLIKCFSKYIPTKIIPNILNEDDIDIVIDEIVNKKIFEKSDTEIEIIDNIEELNFPHEYENNSIIILDDLNQKEMEDPRV